MDFEDCVKFANENPVAWLATTEGDQPRVRALGMWFADNTGFYFQIGGTKDIYKQLLENPKVEAGFFRPDDMSGTMMRIAGEIEFLDDVELKKRVLKDRPFLKQFGLTHDSPDLVIFKISKGESHFWTFETNLQPKEIIGFGD